MLLLLKSSTIVFLRAFNSRVTAPFFLYRKPVKKSSPDLTGNENSANQPIYNGDEVEIQICFPT